MHIIALKAVNKQDVTLIKQAVENRFLLKIADFVERFVASGELWNKAPSSVSPEMWSAVKLAVEWLKGNRVAESTILESLYREKTKRPKRDQVELLVPMAAAPHGV